MSREDHDEQTARCPRLGDFVPFKYCRSSGHPFCWVIIECWAVRLDIGQFLADHYPPEEIQAGLARPESGDRLKKMMELSEKWKG